MDNATLRSIYNASVPQQPQQQQTLSNTPKGVGEQQQQIIPTNTITTNHRKSHSLDAAAALSSTSNDYGAISGSNSGLTALLAPCNITAAAVAASATTKSTQCSRERYIYIELLVFAFFFYLQIYMYVCTYVAAVSDV